MPVEFKDYYKILGVPRDASEADIKKAFRKLAREYHPDVAKDKVRGAAKFQEINEANEVLSDPDKRRRYDALGMDWNRPEGERAPPSREGFGGRAPGGAEFHFDGTGYSDFFEQFFGSRGHAFGGFGPGGAYGRGGEAGPQRGQDIESDILVPLDEVVQGATRTIKLQRTDPRSAESTVQTLRVKIPIGVQDGQLIRLAGKGLEGVGGGEAGNLYLRVKFARHPDFRVRGADVFYDLDLAPWEAVLGASVQIATLDGAVSMKIPAGTEAGRQFRLRGKGLPTTQGTRGDLYATVIIQVPTQLTPEQRAQWEQVAATATFNPRGAP